MRRYYEILDISEDATPEQIEKAYKRAASKHHPDKNPGNEEAAAKLFQGVKEAYECLIDPERKIVYDETGDSSIETGNPAEDLLVHILNEILDEYETMNELLAKCRSVIGEMIDECSRLSVEGSSRVLLLGAMQRSLKFKGKGANFLEGVISDKIKQTNGELKNLGDAKAAAQGVKEILADYEATDRPRPNRGKEIREVQKELKALNNLFSGPASGKRRGGMPFSGV